MPEVVSSAVVINSPHSGRNYPTEFLAAAQLCTRGIRKSEDYLVDELFLSCLDHGIPMMHAVFPRAYLDVNREPYELDPAMFTGLLPDSANTRSIRVSSGLGTIARIVAEGEEIYRDKINVQDGLMRIENIYKPYHAALRHLLAKTHAKFGQAILLDCHSMPSTGSIGALEQRPDIVLGDRFGNSCAAGVLNGVRTILSDMGFRVEINKPYAGGFITEHYGRPSIGIHALQIEINRGLYMDEQAISRSDNFETFKGQVSSFLESISEISVSDFTAAMPAAAE